MYGAVLNRANEVLVGLVLAGIVLCFSMPAYADVFPLGETEEVSAFSEEHIQLRAPSDTGNRPPLIYEGGDLFLGVGDLYEGFETPWGAVSFGFLGLCVRVCKCLKMRVLIVRLLNGQTG